MKLNELVQTYDGDVLFDARETEMVRDEAQERPIVSFDRNEREAIKSEILERPVEKYRVEVSPVTIVAVLGEMPAEGGDNTDPGTEPAPDPSTDTPSEEV